MQRPLITHRLTTVLAAIALLTIGFAYWPTASASSKLDNSLRAKDGLRGSGFLRGLYDDNLGDDLFHGENNET